MNLFFFFIKQKTAYEMRISDWSSDVCSSDLNTRVVFVANPNNPTGTWFDAAALGGFLARVPERVLVVLDEAYIEYAEGKELPDEIGRASCRERVCKYV